MKKILFRCLFFTALTPCILFAQELRRPKLVIGIVVDQMRNDYLTRFYDKFSEKGFKKLMNGGFYCANTHYNYVPTFTGPGHASIYTGTTPSIHGIVANEWFDRNLNDSIYCVEDKKVELCGNGKEEAGRMSPVNLMSTTITDELKLATGKRSKVFGIALKDRGAILPAGHMANGAFWFDSHSGNWISSSFYYPDKNLPTWVKSFNEEHQPSAFLKKEWNTFLPIEKYTESTEDDKPYEAKIFGTDKPVFPYLPEKGAHGDFEILRYTPWGNTLTREMAERCLKHENLGKGEDTDFLAISFSSTDYIGHQFGPNSVELEDAYIRLDQELGQLLDFIEKEGLKKEDVLVFLTADHGAAHVPSYLKENKISAGVIDTKMLLDSLNKYLNKSYPQGLISCYMNQQIYLNYNMLDAKKISFKEIQEKIAAFFLRFNGVSGTLTSINMRGNEYNKGVNNLINNGFNLKRSGDIIVTLEPGWFEGKKTGTTHGSPYNYDTHVPLIFYGYTVPKGVRYKRNDITDIASTLSFLMKIESPSGSTGEPVEEILR